MATVTQAYRFALDPTPAQERRLASHAGAARFAYNWGLARVKACLEARAWERRILGAAVTEAPFTLAALRREWNEAKEQVAPWWAENSKEAYSSGLRALADGLIPTCGHVGRWLVGGCRTGGYDCSCAVSAGDRRAHGRAARCGFAIGS